MSGAADLHVLMADQQHAWSSGRGTPVESYLDSHPFLHDRTEDLLDLIYHEIVLRERAGEMPTLDEYTARFPHLAAQLREQFEVHRALPNDLFDPQATSDHLEPHWQRKHEPPPAIPDYEILDLVGDGGMGVVYRARHRGLKRIVALKVLRDWAAAGAKDKSRLRQEAETVARLQHPNVVQVFDVGEVGGCPFIAFEFVEGGSLDQLLAGTPQPPLHAARLLETIARAVHAAHARGLIHCDLKPANVLLHTDGDATSTPIPKITDFGLARRLDPDDGQSERLGGTVAYMAPEQAAGRIDQIGPASDVHALGAMLYEMLTGRPPFLGANRQVVLNQVLSYEPVPPRRQQPGVPADIETICLKCLQKDPAKRYDSAAALADDLARFAEGRPIMARPVSVFERSARWCRRNRLAASLVLAFTLAVIAGTTGTGIAAYLATRRADEAEQAREKADERTRYATQQEEKTAEAKKQVEIERDQVRSAFYETLMIASDRAFDRQQLNEAAQVLDECPVPLRKFEWFVRRANIEGAAAVLNTGAFAAAAMFTPDGTEFATTGGRGKPLVRLWSTTTGQLRESIPAPARFDEGITAAGISRDGKWIAVHTVRGSLLNPDDLTFALDGSGTVRIWDRTAKRWRYEFMGSCFAFSPDGRRIAVGREKSVAIIDLDDGHMVRTVGDLANTVFFVGWDPSGKVVKAAGRTRLTPFTPKFPGVSIEKSDLGKWDLDSGKRVQLPWMSSASSAWTAVALTPDGREIVADAQHIEPSRSTLTRPEMIAQAGADVLAVSPDGQRLAAGRRDGTIQVFDLSSKTLLLILHGHRGPIRSLAYSPDGKNLISAGGSDQTVRIWNAKGALGGPEPLPGLRTAAFSPDGKSIAFPIDNGGITVWDLAERRAAFALPARQEWARYPLEKNPPVAHDLAYRADGKLLAVYSDGRLRVWNPATRSVEDERELLMVVPKWINADHRLHPQGCRFSADAHWVAGFTSSPVQGFCVFDASDGRRVVEANPGGFIAASNVGFDPSARAVRVRVDSNFSNLVNQAWSLETGKSIPVVDPLRAGWESLSPDGARLAIVPNGNGPIQICSAANRRVLATLSGAQPYTRAIFSPDGRWLAGITASGIELYDAAARPTFWKGE